VEHGGAGGGEVQPDLVGARGERAAFDPREAAEALQRAKLGGAGFGGAGAFAAHAHAAGAVGIFGQRMIDDKGVGQQAVVGADGRLGRERFPRREQGDERVVHADGGFPLKLAAEVVERGFGLGAEEHAAGVGVEAVDVGDGVGLVECEHRVVLKQNLRERHVPDTERRAEASFESVFQNDVCFPPWGK